ncbi:hypothetical protein [Ferruginibacter sp.]
MGGKEIKDEPDFGAKRVFAVTAARDHFINSAYGKFDLIQVLLPGEILLYSKPRIIKKLICEKFGLLQNEINNDTFWSWLRRIRKSQEGSISHNKTTQQYTEQFPQDEKIIDWKNFTPSNPLMERNVEQAIIKLVTE